MPNQAALALLARYLEEDVEPADPDAFPVWRVNVELVLTRADLRRVTTGNGDLQTIELLPMIDGGLEGFASSDPDPPVSPLR